MPKMVKVDSIKDGMILADVVMNKFGQTVLPSGVELKEYQKKLLKLWNISAVRIRTGDENEDDLPPVSRELKQKAEENLLRRMNWRPRNDIERDLFNLSVIENAKKLQNTYKNDSSR